MKRLPTKHKYIDIIVLLFLIQIENNIAYILDIKSSYMII
jgi:hypothetical protein